MRQHLECVLPCASSCRAIDRFSILEDKYEDSDGSVPFWPLLQELLSQNITTWPTLLDLLETISVTVRGSSAAAGDYGSLRLAIEHEPSFFTDVWPAILRFAITLPEQFPSGVIAKLLPGETLSLSQGQCASLLAHQFLCSFESPRPDFYDFSVWYDSKQRHPTAVSAYLKSLFTHFHLRGTQTRSELEVKKLEYSLWSADASNPDQATKLSPHGWKDVQLSKICFKRLKLHSTEFHNIEHLGAAGAVVVSANRDIGFGQSATQEELHIGAAPESCVAVLFTPQLKDEKALSINAAQPMIQFTGQRRDISWKVHDPPVTGGRLLLMDALEMDLADSGSPSTGEDDGADDDGLLPDLLERNMTRELTKAYAAFTSWSLTADSTVVTGLWGCGAFNGEPTVKLLLLWMAASLARRRLQVVFDEAEWEYGVSFEKLVKRTSLQSVSGVMALLRAVPKNTERLGVMQWLHDND